MSVIRDSRGCFVEGSTYWLGRKDKPANSGSFQKGSAPWNKGKKTYRWCERCGKKFTTNKGKMTKPHQRFCSLRCAGYRNGNTSLKKKIWSSKKAREWRKNVRERDKVCVRCGASENLHCDHIKPKSLYPELMFDVDNGRLLCFDCHKLTETYAAKL